MSKHETLTAAATPAADVITVPLADLYLSPLNPRQEADEDRVALLAESLLACGLIQNLSGLRDAEGKIGIVAGGRRLRALRIAAEQNPALALVPVKLAPDALTAEAWANAENTAREALAPAQEIRAYGKMRDNGAPVTSIARAFAVTEAHVYRRLALANLPDAVLAALAAGEISLGQASAFTVSEDVALSLQVLAVVRSGHGYSESWIKNRLQPDAVRATDRRAKFVGLEAYQAEGGEVSRDLFEETTYLQNPDLLNRLFAQGLEDAAAEIATAEGWKWVEACEDEWLPYGFTETRKLNRIYGEEGVLSEEEAAEYDALAEAEELNEAGEARLAELEAKTERHFTEAQRALSGCVIIVGRSGEISRTEGLVRPEDAQAAIEAGFLAVNRHASGEAAGSGSAQAKSPYSQTLTADMKALRLASVQGALLGKPELVLDLLAFALSAESGTFSRILDIRADLPVIEPTIKDGSEIDPRLTARTKGEFIDAPDDMASAFIAFQDQGKKARNVSLTTALARLLTYGCTGLSRESSLFDHIEEETKANLRAIWTPTAENFFSRVGGPYMDALLADLLGAEPTDERVKAFSKSKKKDKADIMGRLFADPQTQALYQITPEQAARIAAWRPDCF